MVDGVMRNRREVLKGLGTVSAIITGGSSLAAAQESDKRSRRTGKELRNENARRHLRDNGWTEQNHNIFYKDIEVGFFGNEKKLSKRVNGLQIKTNESNNTDRIKVNLEKLPYRDKQDRQRAQAIQEKLDASSETSMVSQGDVT